MNYPQARSRLEPALPPQPIFAGEWPNVKQRGPPRLRSGYEQEARQKALIEEFHKPPARTPDQLLALVTQLVNRAAEQGASEVQVYQLPQCRLH